MTPHPTPDVMPGAHRALEQLAARRFAEANTELAHAPLPSGLVLPDQPPPAAPSPPRPPIPTLSRDQHIRRIALEAAVKFYADDPDERNDAEVLDTAKTWAAWIRNGQPTGDLR